MSQNDVAWGKLFEERSILDSIAKAGRHEIAAKDINRYREARLMTKFDHKSQLPAIFSSNQLSIQPDSRGTYIIGKFDSYFTLGNLPDPDIEVLPFPDTIETISPDNIFSEATGILCAHNSGIIAELLGEPCELTVMGRMSTGIFDYTISDSTGTSRLPISVKNSQCEIDAGFEGASQFAIIEAKNETVEDFLIRQIYYPYRLWKQKIRKPTIPLFMTVSDGIFSFYKFRFLEDTHYNSLELQEHRRFQLGSVEIELSDIVAVLTATATQAEPTDVPFPQSDSFGRVIDLLQQLQFAGGTLTKEEITTLHAFDARQADYYANAGRYLGIIERTRGNDGSQYQLTAKANEILALNQRNRQLALAKLIVGHEVFGNTLRLYLEQSSRPTREQVIAIMKQAPIVGVEAEATIARRASTVLAWVDWIVELTER
jgi:hypothetical protein